MNDALVEAVAEAVAAFDAGNHAWGRYLLYVLRPYRGAAPAPDPGPVRAALREAALDVPHGPSLEEVRAFHDALLTVRGALAAFVATLPDALRTGDILLVPDAIAEAIAWLEPWATA
jgi:hypothetical protein